MVTRIVRLAWLCASLALSSLPAAAQNTVPQADWISALRDGGYVIVFRHGATHPDQADTDPLNTDNVAKQRQLNDDGRALAKSIGESLRKLRIPVGQVYTSLFKRAIDTGALMGFGDVKVSADYTEGGLVVTPIENNRRAAALRKAAGTMPPASTTSSWSRTSRTSWTLSARTGSMSAKAKPRCSSRTAMAVTRRLAGSRPATGASSPKATEDFFPGFVDE